MKSCDKSSLTLLVAGLLEEGQAQALRTHLESCPACREEYAEMERLCARLSEPITKVPSLTPPPHFHERLRQRLRVGEESASEPGILVLLRSWLTKPGIILALATCVVAVVLVLKFYPQAKVTPEISVAPPPAAPARPLELAQTSTALAYQRALNESLEALEALLDQNARCGTPSAMTLVSATSGAGQ